MGERDDFSRREDRAEDLVSGILAFHLYPPPSRTTETGDLDEPLLVDYAGDSSRPSSAASSSFVANALDWDDHEKSFDPSKADSPLHRMVNGTSDTDSETTAGTDDATPSPSFRRPWNIPIQSIVLLNLVAVIWGTQHSVIKMVVDDQGIGLGADSDEGIVQNEATNNIGDGANAGGTAAYFTLARFGLAALLASPYTPGCRLWANYLKKKLGWKESTAPVDSVDGADGGEEQRHTQLDRPRQNADGAAVAASNSHTNATSERESVKLAWKYGAELGMWMFLGYSLQAIGLETTTASRSGFLLYLNVKFVPFFSYIIFGKSIKLNTWISAVVAFSGTALLLFDNTDAGADGPEKGSGTPFTIGDLWSIGAAAASAMFILRMEAASKAVSKPSELNAASLWVVAALSLAWAMGVSWNHSTGDTQAFFVAFGYTIQRTFQRSLSTIITHPLPVLYLSGVTTTAANLLQSKAQKHIPAERAAVIYAMDPVYGAVFANILLGETLGVMGLVGACLIVFAAAANALLDSASTRDDEVV